MLAIASAVLSVLSCRLRSRISLELEIIALRHQLTVLRRQRPGRPRLLPGDRLLWIWLYRLWASCLNAMILVKPTTVVQWHHMGFRRYWRWRSWCHGPGRPAVASEVRDLIRQMSKANPLWGAPRIHGELLKLGISIGQTAVSKYMARRGRSPSPSWRTFLRNQMHGIAAIDMFVVATATFRLLYVMVILHHARRTIVHFDVTDHPSQDWLSQQVSEAFPWGTAPRYLLRDRDGTYGQRLRGRVQAMGMEEVITAPRSRWQNPLCRAPHWLNPPRMTRSHRHLQRATPAARLVVLPRLVPSISDASRPRKGLLGGSSRTATGERQRHRHS